jgi:hypothetical protein
MEIHHAIKLGFVKKSVSKRFQVALGFGFDVNALSQF